MKKKDLIRLEQDLKISEARIHKLEQDFQLLVNELIEENENIRGILRANMERHFVISKLLKKIIEDTGIISNEQFPLKEFKSYIDNFETFKSVGEESDFENIEKKEKEN